MRWEDEPWIRVYTRDTVEWKLLPWEARAVFVLLFRKVDRAGVLELGRWGARGVAVALDMPLDVVERGLDALRGDGCVRLLRDDREREYLLIPNFIDAQSATASAKARMQVHRDRQRARDRLAKLAPITTSLVTPCNDPVTGRNEGVTERHGGVTSQQSGVTSRSEITPYSLREYSVAASAAAVPRETPPTLFPEEAAPPPSKPRRKRKPKPNGEATPGYREFVDAFFAAFRSVTGTDPEWGQKQGAMAKRVLAKPGGLQDALARAGRMFSMAGKFPAEHPDMSTLVAHWDKFAPLAPGTKVVRGRVAPKAFEEYPEPGQDKDF